MVEILMVKVKKIRFDGKNEKMIGQKILRNLVTF